MTTVTSNFTGSIPTVYEEGLVPVIFTDFAQNMARRVAELGPTKVLELASGTGVVTRLLRNRLSPECTLVASDLNDPMLAIARRKFKADERVSFESVDAMNLPFENQSFDVLTCQYGVMFFPDKIQSFTEAHRMLKDGGHYIFSTWDSLARNPFATIVQRVIEDTFAEDPPGFYKVPFHYHDPDAIRLDMQKAGFSAVTVEQHHMRKAIPSMDVFANALVYGNPLYEEIKMRHGDADAMVASIKQALVAKCGQSAPVLELSSFFITGRK